MSSPAAVPTLLEWMGGTPALERLLARFYQRVPEDPLIGPLFARMDPEHAKHVAAFVARSSAVRPRTVSATAATRTWSATTAAGC